MTRGTLRSIVAWYRGEHPANIRFVTSAYGKPRLANGAGADPLFFNVARSRDTALMCLSATSEVGVDVECLREVPEAAAIARRHFSVREADLVCGGDAARRSERFLTCWTRKEAVVKALGRGLSVPLQTFEVSPRAPAGQVDYVQLACGSRWSVLGLRLEGGFLGAVAARGLLAHCEILCAPEQSTPIRRWPGGG